jgi:hypothetical protein
VSKKKPGNAKPLCRASSFREEAPKGGAGVSDTELLSFRQLACLQNRIGDEVTPLDYLARPCAP